MKIQSRRKKPQANKIFTDREEPRESFWKNYLHYKEMMQGEGEVKVLSYYGIGGIGKTTLLHKLQEEMRERIREPKYVYFDFNIAQDTRTVLDYLKTKLGKDYGYTFPLYELGVYAYAQKIGEDMASPQIKGFIEKSPLLSFAVSAVGAIPVAGVVSQIANATDKGIVYLRTQIKKHENNEIKDIENKTPDELYNYLPYLFAQDMANALEDNEEPLVVFFDTYEKLVNEMSSVGEPLNNDLWIRGIDGLIQNIPNVLWVIAGREKLKWERFDVEWGEALEQHILGNLSRTDADSFLKTAGIGNESLREGLYNLTKGTPVYLDLCVDRYISLVEQGKEPEIADFGKNVYTLIERFARYMDDSRKDIVYMLSCMKIWNDIMVTDLGAKIIPGFSLTTYEKVKDFSFVTKSDAYNYNIHQTVGATLFANCPQVIKDSVRKYVVPYCEERLEASGTFDPIYVYHLQWLVRFGLLHFENDDEFIAFYNEHLKPYLKRLAVSGQAILAEHIFEPVMIRANKTGESLLKALALSESSFWKHKKGEFAVSVTLAEESVALYEKLLSNTDLRTLKAKHRLGERLRANGEYQRSYDVLNEDLSVRKSLSLPMDEEEVDLRDDIASAMLLLGKYKEALPFIEKVLKLREQLPKEEKPSWYNTLWNLGDVYYNLGRYQDSLSVSETLYNKSQELLGKRHLGTIKAVSRLAGSFASLGRYKEEFPLREQVLELRKEILGEKHPDTVGAMVGLANSYSNLGRYKDALPLREQVLELRKEILGEKHPDTISAMTGVASSLSNLGRYKDALPLREQVLELRKEILGEKHPDTISAIVGLADVLFYLGRYKEELLLREQVLALRKEVLGEKHPNTLAALWGLAVSLYNLGRYQEALSVRVQVLALYKEVLGEKHPETISAMHNLAVSLSSLGKYQEALPLREQVLTQFKEILGVNHPVTITAMNNLALSLYSLGRFQQAFTLQKQVLALRREILGERHPDTITAMHNLAVSLSSLGRYQEALPLREQVLAQRREILGESHPETLTAMSNLAGSLESLGRFQEALSLRKQVLAVRKDILGEKHKLTISAMNGLAWGYYLSEKFQEGLTYAEEAVRLQDEVNDLTEKSKINTLDTLALLYAETGKIDRALVIASNNLEIIKTKYLSDKLNLASKYYSFAYCQNKAQRFQEALPNAEQAYMIQKEEIGENNSKTIKAKELLEEIKQHL